jgi:hypothetical protein
VDVSLKLKDLGSKAPTQAACLPVGVLR